MLLPGRWCTHPVVKANNSLWRFRHLAPDTRRKHQSEPSFSWRVQLCLPTRLSRIRWCPYLACGWFHSHRIVRRLAQPNKGHWALVSRRQRLVQFRTCLSLSVQGSPTISSVILVRFSKTRVCGFRIGQHSILLRSTGDPINHRRFTGRSHVDVFVEVGRCRFVG